MPMATIGSLELPPEITVSMRSPPPHQKAIVTQGSSPDVVFVVDLSKQQ
jgi:hypothetical protein